MDTRAVIKADLKGCDREEIAKAIGMSLGSLNNQVAGEKPYLPKGSSPNFLDKVYNFIDATITTTGQSAVLDELAKEFGFVLVENPNLSVTKQPAINQIAKMLNDFAELVDEVGQAHQDSNIDCDEAARIREKWETMKKETEGFVLACETGMYRCD